jgi:hypothetical protein
VTFRWKRASFWFFGAWAGLFAVHAAALLIFRPDRQLLDPEIISFEVLISAITAFSVGRAWR